MPRDGRREGFSDRSLRRLAERLPPPLELGRAGDGLADRRDEEARGTETDRDRRSPSEDDGRARLLLLLRSRPWGVLAALAVICDDVVWCDAVDTTSLALLMTLSICIIWAWGDGEGARPPPPLPLPAVGGWIGG